MNNNINSAASPINLGECTVGEVLKFLGTEKLPQWMGRIISPTSSLNEKISTVLNKLDAKDLKSVSDEIVADINKVDKPAFNDKLSQIGHLFQKKIYDQTHLPVTSVPKKSDVVLNDDELLSSLKVLGNMTGKNIDVFEDIIQKYGTQIVNPEYLENRIDNKRSQNSKKSHWLSPEI